jgi:hypothetical protein
MELKDGRRQGGDTESYGILVRNVKKWRMLEVQFLLGRHVEGTEARLGYGAFG